MAKITIEVPDGYEVQVVEKKKEEQKKPTVKTYEDLMKLNLQIRGYYPVASDVAECNIRLCKGYGEIAASKKVAKSMLAMAMISQLMPYYGGEITNKEWKDENIEKYTLVRNENNIIYDRHKLRYQFLAFHTSDYRNKFLLYNEQLVKDYLMVD